MKYNSLAIALMALVTAKVALADSSPAGCISQYIESAKVDQNKINVLEGKTQESYTPYDHYGLFSITSAPSEVISNPTEISKSRSSYDEKMKIAQMISESYAGDGLELRLMQEKLMSSNANLEFEDLVKAVWSFDNNQIFCLKNLLTYAQIQDLLTRSMAKKK